MYRLVDSAFLNCKAWHHLFGPFSLRCPCCHSVWSQSTPSWITSKEGESSVCLKVTLLLIIWVCGILMYYLCGRLLRAITQNVWQHIINFLALPPPLENLFCLLLINFHVWASLWRMIYVQSLTQSGCFHLHPLKGELFCAHLKSEFTTYVRAD